MTVDRVAVEAELGVEQLEVAVVHDDQRVDFQHLHVLLDEGTVEVAQQGHALLDLAAFQPEGEGNAAAVIGHVAGGRVDGEAQDLFGRAGGHFLDVHAAFGRSDDRDAAGATVHQEGEVQFTRNVRAILDVDAVDLLAGGAGLVRDQGLAQHLLGFLGGFRDRFGEADTALFAGFGFLEAALAAATCVDLRLHHPERAVELTSGGFRIFCLQDHSAIADRGAVFAKQCLRLVFMNVHETVPCCCWSGSSKHKFCVQRNAIVPHPQAFGEKTAFCDHSLKKCDHKIAFPCSQGAGTGESLGQGPRVTLGQVINGKRQPEGCLSSNVYRVWLRPGWDRCPCRRRRGL